MSTQDGHDIDSVPCCDLDGAALIDTPVGNVIFARLSFKLIEDRR
jgi:hypothetical protein